LNALRFGGTLEIVGIAKILRLKNRAERFQSVQPIPCLCVDLASPQDITLPTITTREPRPYRAWMDHCPEG
jgi:hypothetical protein